MAGRIEGDDAIAARQKRASQIDEAGTATPPTVHQEDSRTALSPGPGGHPSRPNGDVEAPGLREPSGHPLADLPPWRGTEQSFRPERCQPRRCPLYHAECGPCEPKCGVHLRSVRPINHSLAVSVHESMSVTAT